MQYKKERLTRDMIRDVEPEDLVAFADASKKKPTDKPLRTAADSLGEAFLEARDNRNFIPLLHVNWMPCRAPIALDASLVARNYDAWLRLFKVRFLGCDVWTLAYDGPWSRDDGPFKVNFVPDEIVKDIVEMQIGRFKEVLCEIDE